MDREAEQARAEYDNLQAAIAKIEGVVAFSVAPPTLLATFLANARAQLVSLEKRLKEAKAEKEHQAEQVEAVIAMQVARETALNEREKEEFGSFLNEKCFTKRDFDRLERFYTLSWERLSETGKEAMSTRVWEGVRHGEYRFSELPKVVQEKEAEQAYSRLREPGGAAAAGIPESDRADFIKTYGTGRREEVSKILDRESFKQGMAGVYFGRGASPASETDRMANRERGKKPEGGGSADIDVSSVDLTGFKLADSDARPATELSQDKPIIALQK